jgi:hypothetical protein
LMLSARELLVFPHPLLPPGRASWKNLTLRTQAQVELR